MHSHCEAKWERRKTLRPLVDSFLYARSAYHPQLAIDIALLIEQKLDGHGKYSDQVVFEGDHP